MYNTIIQYFIDNSPKGAFQSVTILKNVFRMLQLQYVIQLTPHWGFSVADCVGYYAYF